MVLPQETVERLWTLTEADPTAEVTVDLEAREVRAEGVTAPFELDENARWRLLERAGRHQPHPSATRPTSPAYEAQRPSFKPRTLPV